MENWLNSLFHFFIFFNENVKLKPGSSMIFLTKIFGNEMRKSAKIRDKHCLKLGTVLGKVMIGFT